MDAAHEWTDGEIKRLAERIRYHYRKSAAELSAKAGEHLASYQRNLVKTRRLYESGAISAEDFAKWRSKWAAIAASDARMVADLTASAQRATAEARAMIAGEAPSVFAECANFGAYEIDTAIRADTAFDLLNADAVLYMMQRNPKVLPIPQDSLMRGATERWHSQKLTSAITQGIIQGESVPQIAQRIGGVSKMDSAAAVRAARTALTCAENMGKLSSYERAEELGIPVILEWTATPDDRTRPSHRDADGQERKPGELFDVGGARLSCPGDPAGGEEAWNCRCSLNAKTEGMAFGALERWTRLPEGTTYAEWKAGKQATRAEGQRVADRLVGPGWSRP